MADRSYRNGQAVHMDSTDGGEATPRPLKAQRLVDMMEPSSKGKGTGQSAADAPPRRQKAASEPSVSETTVPKQSAPRQPAPKQPAPKQPAPKQPAPKQPAPDLPPDFPPDTCAVLSVSPAGEGETVTVVLALPDPAGKKAQRVSFCLLVEQYAELEVKTGEITPEEADALLDAGRLCGAIRRGIALLGYGDQSARRLAYKLTAKGVDRDTAARATAYLTEKGYIREDDTATLRAEQDLRKGWGERRIREDLIAHGFTHEAVEEAMEELSNTDWVETCAAAIRKKYGKIPEDKGERQKMLAAMMRLGYDTDTVKAAARNILREK